MNIDKYKGAILGLAAGDALGTSIEFQPRGTFVPLTDIVGGGPFNLKKGEWTDDTSMALCLAESLIQRKGFDAVDQLMRYTWWHDTGHLSATGKCFDIGNTVLAALHVFRATRKPFCGSTDPQASGNGSIMRLAPVVLAYAADPRTAIDFAGLSSRTTHGSRISVDACRYLAALLIGALRGVSKAQLLAGKYEPVAGYWDQHPLCPEIERVAEGSFKTANVRGTGYAAASLEAALWAFHNSTTFEQGCLMAANLGDDADTTAAVYGQLAGAFYGASGIPSRWVNVLAKRNLLDETAKDLLALSKTKPATFVAGKGAVTAMADAIMERWSADTTGVVPASEVIESIPIRMASARRANRAYVELLSFGKNEWTHKPGAVFHPYNCEPEFLHEGSVAKLVWDYCVEQQLQPRIVAQGPTTQCIVIESSPREFLPEH